MLRPTRLKARKTKTKQNTRWSRLNIVLYVH